MISLKSMREIELMRQAGMVLSKTRLELEKHLKPGISTHQLDLIAENYIKSQGCKASFKNYNGFPASICASVNEVVIHGIPKKSIVLKDGDIISIDLGVECNGYHADSAWTYPIGKVSSEVLQLLKVTKEALDEGLKMVKPGNRVGDISHAIETFVKPYGYGIVEEFTGHGIGRTLHEDPYIPNFGPADTGETLKAGMTICIEPMVNLGTKKVKVLSDNWTTVTLDKKPSAHFEYTVAINETGFEILTPVIKE